MAHRRHVLSAVTALAAAALLAAGSPAESTPPKQSPIDVVLSAIRPSPSAPALAISYGHSPVDLSYASKDSDCAHRHEEETEVAQVAAGAGHVTFDGVRYELAQFHFHTPSEHTFEGVHTPLEMHLVHRSAAGEYLVIGVPLVVGAPSTADTVLAQLAPECGPSQHLDDVDLDSLLPPNRATLRYTGSLTTSPFDEGVRWFLMAPRQVTAGAVARFQHLFTDGNSRPTQPLNGRTVEWHR
ncbi:carbonic anhydrase family protein [Actinokineospora sp. G85]|uniref:carbonic anhydrase family protein n=1 Tax=Actinokineospora sp. G85 TaxID=3406626 RepID=UPI003C783657